MVVSETKGLTARNVVFGPLAVIAALFTFAAAASGQQPATQVAPLFATNAKYVQGVGPGYWPTPGSGLTLNLAAGTAFCGGSIRTYGGGSLTMSVSSTNYVYLDTTANCVPAANTTGFSSTTIPIAVVTTGASAITSVADDRTFFFAGGTGGSGSGTVTSVGLTMPSWLSVANSPVTTSGTLAVTASGSQTAHQVLGTGTGSSFGPVTLALADLPATVSTTGSCASNQFQTASTNAGPTCAAALTALTAPAHQFFNSVSAAGVFGAAQPGFSDLVGMAASSQLPAGVLSCAIHDNAICTSAVDAAGNPNFLSAGSGAMLNINGGTTPLVLFIGGVYQTLTSNVTITLPTPASADAEYFIWVKQDTANASLVAADFGSTTIPPVYQYAAPTLLATATSSNPQMWFNLASNTMEWNTAGASGAFVPQASIVLGAAVASTVPAILAVLCEPFRLNPYKRYEVFRDGSGGSVQIRSSSGTYDGPQYLSVLFLDNATLNSHQVAAGLPDGLTILSQNPVILVNNSAVNLNGLGRGINAAGTGAGAPGTVGGAGGGAGGGGGGAGASNSGGSGGAMIMPADIVFTASGGTAGSVGNPGGNGQSATPGPWFFGNSLFGIGIGALGGSGAGDGTNQGGQGNSGGGAMMIVAPSILVTTGSSISANGANGTNAAGGNAGGGGGGGGGTAIIAAGFITNGAGAGYTPTASGGAGGAGQGTGKSGGAGGNGTALPVKLW